ncbi:MAG TPA: hypothetical protein VFR13_03570 [Jiangellaceae bacterium]|nr:hypothetical protein [Jiangellaceae bacterium]
MVTRGTIARFTRWGLRHGPVWGLVAAVVGGIPLAAFRDADVSEAQIVLLGLAIGIAAGPLVGLVTGLTCAAADRAPKWILDAPDYVAVVAVTALVGGLAWPALDLGSNGVPLGALGIVLLAGAPAIDAARSAPRLLRPDMSTPAQAIAVAPPRQAS